MFISRRKYEELQAEIFISNVEVKDLKHEIEELNNDLRSSYLHSIKQRLEGYQEGYKEGYDQGIYNTLYTLEMEEPQACDCGCYEEYDEGCE